MSFRTILILTLCPFLTTGTARAAAEIDPTGPKAALKSLYEALEASDAASVRNLFHANTETERQLADAYAAQLNAARTLGEAASRKFGATGDALSKGIPVKDQIAQLQQAHVAIDGNNATLKFPNQQKPLRLTKLNGVWKIIVSDYAGEDLAGQTAVMKDMTAVFNAVAADINADKLPTPHEAQRALQQKLQAVLFNTLTKHAPPTTTRASTTTKPAATPPPALSPSPAVSPSPAGDR